jgi:hypothetical protein
VDVLRALGEVPQELLVAELEVRAAASLGVRRLVKAWETAAATLAALEQVVAGDASGAPQ